MARPSKVHPHRGKWRFRFGGIEHICQTKREAQRKLHLLLADRDGQPSERPAGVPGLIDAWLALHPSSDYQYRLADLAHVGADDLLPDVSPGLFDRLLARLRAKRYAAKTIFDRMATSRRVLAYGVRMGWVSELPETPVLPKPKRVARDIPAEIITDVLDSLPTRARRIIAFWLVTGCRPLEACRLRWDQVRLDQGVCKLPTHKTADKTGEDRIIRLTPRALDILADVPKLSPFVFVSRLNQPYTVGGLRSILRRKEAVFGVSLSPYRFRHTFAQLASETLAPDELQQLMGHRDFATTQIYYRVRDARLSDAAASLDVVAIARTLASRAGVAPRKKAKRKARKSSNPRKAKRPGTKPAKPRRRRTA